MLRYILLTLALGAASITLHAQPTRQVQHWDFDGSDQAFAPAMRKTTQPNVADGIKAFGVYLDGQGVYFEPTAPAPSADFSLSFWTYLTTTFTPRTLLVHTQGATTFHARVAAGQLALYQGTQLLDAAPKPLNPGVWYHWAYVRQGSRITYYLDGERVYEGAWDGKGAQQLAIGAARGEIRSLEGVLDEVSLAATARPQVELLEEIATLRPAPPIEAPTEAPKDAAIQVSQPPTPDPTKRSPAPVARPDSAKAQTIRPAAVRQLALKWKDKRNLLSLEIPVMASSVALRYWNDETYYDENISLQLNGDTTRQHLSLLVPRSARRAATLSLDLDPDALNYLTIAAEDMSIYDQQQKLKFQLIVDGVPFEDVYEVAMTRYQNAVIALNHIPLNPDKPTIVPIASASEQRYQIVVENTILDPVVLSTQRLTVQLTNNANAPREIALTLNASKLIKTVRLEAGETQTIALSMRTPDQDVLILEAMYLSEGERLPIAIAVINDEGVALADWTTDLSAVNNLLPIAYVPPAVAKRADNEKYIIVDTEDIVLQVRDFSKVDGDIVTIKQNGQTLLEDYTLTSDFRDVPVKLIKGELNRLTFIPVSMGRSQGENTAYVMVRANGKVIHEFSLRSLDVNKPARIYIQYAGE